MGLIIMQRILAGILIVILLIILAGTVFALFFKPEETRSGYSSEPQADAESDSGIFTGKGIFTGIGRIRTKSAEPKSAAVMITVAFPYNPHDISFSEELASKVAQFRSETSGYFEALTADELRLKTDAELQRELLARYNAGLRLGFIDVLYITDYVIIE